MIVDSEIELRPLNHDDAERIFKAIDANREYLGEWLPFVDFTRSIKDSEAFIKSVLEVPPEKSEFVWTIWYYGNFAGLIGTKFTDRINQRTEIGYWQTEPHQSMGIVSRSLYKVLEYLFSEENMNRISLKVGVGNLKSKRIPIRLGFKNEGIERDAEKMSDGHFIDAEVFSLLKREFKITHEQQEV